MQICETFPKRQTWSLSKCVLSGFWANDGGELSPIVRPHRSFPSFVFIEGKAAKKTSVEALCGPYLKRPFAGWNSKFSFRVCILLIVRSLSATFTFFLPNFLCISTFFLPNFRQFSTLFQPNLASNLRISNASRLRNGAVVRTAQSGSSCCRRRRWRSG